MKLIDILNNIEYKCNNFQPNFEISDIIFDSRKAITPSDMFVCLKGFTFDSHDFAGELYNKGVRVFAVQQDISLPDDAVKIVVDDTRKFLALSSANFFGRPAEKLNTIAITGTKGKTSVSFMLKSVYEAAGHKVGVIGSTGTYIGDKEYETANSTPESYLLHKYYKEMLDAGCDTAIIEATSQGFKMDRTYGIEFNTGIFTNLSPDHIGGNEHKDFEEYLNCKKMIFDQCKKVIINADSDNYDEIINGITCPLITVSEDSLKNPDYSFGNGEFHVGDNKLTTQFTFAEDNISAEIDLKTPGRFSLCNAALAAACARRDGLSYNEIKQGLSKAFVKGRMEIVPIEKDYTVIIDFAHNEFSVKTLFDTIKLYNPKRIISVFGCGGNRSKLRRYGMGEVIGANSDLSIITSDNSRFEKIEDIISDILIGMHKTDGKYEIIPNRRDAIKEALRIASKGDIVLLIGKGHEMYEEIEGVQYPFDEREVVFTSLRELEQQGDL
ncbi:MAG: UDP-N-acetylmuramoyl-L-alanyl-D-glutamate--2,6-diaminopimelate ligase [Ruminococcaceae bacterium]|nr:UDP-N-acetylmuramoyl-L-alanyl-D-glutamate--2,6-diaminopimelate ligase [Oscillospiraceae bacterium]